MVKIIDWDSYNIMGTGEEQRTKARTHVLKMIFVLFTICLNSALMIGVTVLILSVWSKAEGHRKTLRSHNENN